LEKAHITYEKEHDPISQYLRCKTFTLECHNRIKGHWYLVKADDAPANSVYIGQSPYGNPFALAESFPFLSVTSKEQTADCASCKLTWKL
jgi:hypothetical protein